MPIRGPKRPLVVPQVPFVAVDDRSWSYIYIVKSFIHVSGQAATAESAAFFVSAVDNFRQK